MVKNQNTVNTSQNQALSIANGNQKKGQSKAQTKLIAAGIEKGIAQYKKQHKAKMREQDKLRKKRYKENTTANNETSQTHQKPVQIIAKPSPLAWVLLAISWVGFISYWLINQPA